MRRFRVVKGKGATDGGSKAASSANSFTGLLAGLAAKPARVATSEVFG